MARDFDNTFEQRAYDRATSAMKQLLNLPNSCPNSGIVTAVVAGMVDAFIAEHRTLQQAGLRNFAAMLQEWGKGDKPALVDDRNADAWNFAQDVRVLEPSFRNI